MWLKYLNLLFFVVCVLSMLKWVNFSLYDEPLQKKSNSSYFIILCNLGNIPWIFKIERVNLKTKINFIHLWSTKFLNSYWLSQKTFQLSFVALTSLHWLLYLLITIQGPNVVGLSIESGVVSCSSLIYLIFKKIGPYFIVG